MDRRHFLRAGAALAALGGGAISLPARAGTGYRALVALMLYGGNDGLNTVVPMDPARFGQYTAVRGGLALNLKTDVNGQTGPLLPFGAGDWALHPRLNALQAIANAGQLAHVANVGPLVRPTTRANYAEWREVEGMPLLPEALFSHSDQQKLWQNGADRCDYGKVGTTGWGARVADALGAGLYSFSGSSRFGAGTARSALNLPRPGVNMRTGLDAWKPTATSPAFARLNAAFLDSFKAPIDSPLFQAFARIRASSLDAVSRLDSVILATPSSNPAYAAVDAAFTRARPNGPASSAAWGTTLGSQLYQVAKMIASNAAVGGSRHVYFVSLNGFDTHGDQLGIQAALLGQVGVAVAAFMEAMVALGLGDAVTVATLSDFGRTFKPNASRGTDHGWGNTQLVLGGAVKGGAWGSYADLTLGGSDDAGIDSWEQQGRWIPTSSVDQYAATLARWLGAGEAALDAAFPNLANFGQRDLGFLRA